MAEEVELKQTKKGILEIIVNTAEEIKDTAGTFRVDKVKFVGGTFGSVLI